MTQKQDLKLGGIDWHLDDMNVRALWEKLGHKGKGVKIGFVDEGFHLKHPDFYKEDIHYLGVARDGKIHQEAEGKPVSGHGTTVLSAALGVAPDASFYLVSHGPDLREHNIVAALREVAQHVDVINISFVSQDRPKDVSFAVEFGDREEFSVFFDTSLAQTIRELREEGKIIVVAAGNDAMPLFMKSEDNLSGLKEEATNFIWNAGSDVYRAIDTTQHGDTLVVGAHTIDHKLAPDSNWGKGHLSSGRDGSVQIEGGITVTAPGGHRDNPSKKIFLATHPEVSNRHTHAYVAGTSFTSPFTAAIIAIGTHAYQATCGERLNKRETEDLLAKTANRDTLDPIPEERNTNYQGLDGRFDEKGRSHFFGYGAIDALKFWEKAMEGAQQVVSDRKLWKLIEQEAQEPVQDSGQQTTLMAAACLTSQQGR